MNKEISKIKYPGMDEYLHYRDDVARESIEDISNRIGVKVIVTNNGSTPPTDTSALWVYPEE